MGFVYVREEYKDDDLGQLLNSREFLEALKKKSLSEDDDILHYCLLFASIPGGIVLRKGLDLSVISKRLPERVRVEVFYRHDIDLEDDDDGIDFEDLLQETLALIGCRKWLADFIKKEESDWKFTSHPKDQPTAQVAHHSIPPAFLLPTTSNPDIVKPFTYKPRELSTIIQVVQDGVPIARVSASRAKENETV